MPFPVKVKAALAGLTVAGGAAAAALLGPAGPAVGQASQPVQVQIQVSSPATLVAKGAAADVSVTASCSGSSVSSGQISVSLTERAGAVIASGGQSSTIDCTGTPATVVLVVPANGRPYKKGTAIANGAIFACTTTFGSCANQQVTATIEIGG
jgi:hypothetical protein